MDESEVVYGELVSSQRQLFKVRGEDGSTTFLALDHVHAVGTLSGSDILYVHVGDTNGTIDHPEDIARFWAQWEIV